MQQQRIDTFSNCPLWRKISVTARHLESAFSVCTRVEFPQGSFGFALM